MSSRTATLALAAALVVSALVPASGAGMAPLAARDCTPPGYPGSGYFTALSVKGTSCKVGKRLALAYYRCRTATGPAGRCTRKVKRFSCTEVRQSISTQLDGRVRCKRGDARVTHSYQQNL